jgi:hypothetical protein
MVSCSTSDCRRNKTSQYPVFLSGIQMLFSLERYVYCSTHKSALELTFTALKGSDHLDFLVDSRLLKPTSTGQIESIYNKTVPNLLNSFTFVTRSQVLEGTDPEESLLLQPGSHKLVARSLEVPELAAEVERAVRQVKESLERQAEQETQQMEASSKEKEQMRK